MKKILYVDIESPSGHVSLNKSMLNNLSMLSNVEITCVFRAEYLKSDIIPSHFKLISIPNWLYSKKDLGAFFNRVLMLIRLYYLKVYIGLNSYDIVFISCYDEIVYFFGFISQKVYLLNNINLSGLTSTVKKFFYKKISKKNVQVVFEDYMQNYLKTSLGVDNILVLKHGLPNNINLDVKSEYLLDFDMQIMKVVLNKQFLFIPSATSTDQIFLNNLLSSVDFRKFLKENDLFLIFKGSEISTINENILIVNRYLSDIEYNFLFSKCFGVIISYPENFRYRVSNVFFECIANNKICFLSNIEALLTYKPNIVRPYFYKTINDLILNIENELFLKRDMNITLYRNLKDFYVDYECLQNYISNHI